MIEAPRLRALGVGAAKTGTKSLALVLAGAFAARHEPDSEELLQAVLAFRAGRIGAPELRARVAELLDGSGLEISVSQINGFIIDQMVELYPQALYLLTVRDAESWLRSLFNHMLSVPIGPKTHWMPFRKLRFDVERHPFQPSDEPLRRRGLPGLEACLSYWAEHTARVVGAVGPDRLMVVPTYAIERELPRIAKALGVSPDRLGLEHSHSHKREYLPSPVDELDAKLFGASLTAHSVRLWTTTKPLLTPVELGRMEEAIFRRATVSAAPGS